MDETQIRQLLEEASDRYNEARYDEAMSLWREVLARDPANQKAREGIRMASLLTGDWATPSHPPEVEASRPADPEAQEVLPRIEAGIARVRELAAAGRIAEALEGCALLAEIAPTLDEVRRLTQEVKRVALPEPVPGPAPIAGPIEERLERARRALAEGRNTDAAEAARFALEADPSNMEACGILSLVGEDVEIAAPADPGVETGPVPAFDLKGGPISLEDEPAERAEEPLPATPAVDGRIEGLLTSGQQASDAGRFQDAIEIWSRIFAIDRTNAEAGVRIDRAKAAVEEQARHIDELYYRAVDANEANRLEEALGLFQQVLAISPHHQEAISFVEEINLRLGGLGEPIRVDPGAAREAADEKQRQLAADTDERGPGELHPVPWADGGLKSPYPPRVPAEHARSVETAAAAVPGPGRSTATRSGGSRGLPAAVAGVIVVAVVGAGAWLWIGGYGGSMPEARATVPAPVERPARPAPDGSASRARADRAKGSPAPLEVVPGSPQAEPPPAAGPQPLDPEALKGQAAAQSREGRQYYQQKRWAEAVLAFRRALAADPVGFDAQDLLDKAMAELEKQAKIEREMDQATRAFSEKDYASALQKFYRVQQDHPDMKVLDTYIRNSWFDWGVTLLQEGSPDEAAERFKEVLDVASHDKEAARAREFAKRYHGRQRDAVYDTFTEGLALRSLDQP